MQPEKTEYPLPPEDAFHIMYWSGSWKFFDLEWLAKCRANLWIIHPSLPPWNLREILAFCEEQGQPYHLLAEGAVTFDLDLDQGHPARHVLSRSKP
jgi:hypothetical protein